MGGGEKGGVRIFGVTIGGGGVAEAAEGRVGCPDVGTEVMKKSKSMGDLPSAVAAGVASDEGALGRGYVSDEGLRTQKTGRRRRKAEAGAEERKKGTPWSKEEHRTFLEGLVKLGKGDWRGISGNFVLTRTPTQVASHAQKYFIRQNIPSSRKRRSSLFDVAIHDPASTSKTLAIASEDKTQKGCVDMTLQSCKSMKVGAAEVNFKATVPPGIKGPSYSCFGTNGPDPYEPKSFQDKEGVSELMEEKLMLVAPTVIDASQFVDSHKIHVNPPTDSLEFNLLPCHPARANTLHQVAGSSDLNLSTGLPKLHSLNEAPTCDGIGAIRVV